MDIRRTLDMKLESFHKVYNENNIEDPTLIKATFIILEIDKKSENNEIITKEEALKMASTMALKPLTCQYTPTSNFLIPDDHFGSHGKIKEKFRKNGNEFITTNSFAIGVSKEGCYLSSIEKDGEQIEVLKCDFYLWVTRYLNICSLMEDIFNSGIDLYSSCEYIYKANDVKVVDGIKYPTNLFFEGHCLLGKKEDGSIVEPAFEVSKMINFNEKWTSVVNETIETTLKKKEDENMGFKKEDWISVVNELSHGEIKNEFYNALSKVMTADEYFGIWINSYDVYDDYFIYAVPKDDTSKYYKVMYTKTETEVTIDFENRVEVKWTDMWVSVSNAKDNEKTLNDTIAEKENVITSLNEKISTLEGEKLTLNDKYVNATDTITSLNSKVEELQPIADAYNKEQYEKILNEKQKFYKDKFVSLNAVEKYETDEVQDLIIKSLNELNAKEKLSDIILELVPSSNEVDIDNTKIKPSNAIKGLNSMNDIDIPIETEIKNDFDSIFEI